MRAYSEDLRAKALDAVDRGTPRKEVARIFGISLTALRLGAFYANMRRMKPHEELIATIVHSTIGRLCWA